MKFFHFILRDLLHRNARSFGEKTDEVELKCGAI